jgi:hypothetical protein
MAQSAEDVIKARKEKAAPPRPKFEAEYQEILDVSIPETLKHLESQGWPGGDIASVGNAERDGGSLGTELAVWQLTTIIYLTSTGKIAIKVHDPLGDLRYKFAEVSLDYLVKEHGMVRTIRAVHEGLEALRKL